MKLDYIEVREDMYAEHSGGLPVSPTRLCVSPSAIR